MTARKPALGFIFITLLIDITGLGLIIPVTPGLIMELTGQSASEAAQYAGWMLFSYAIMQFAFAPVMGAISDQYGRRPVLLASLFGFGLDYLLMAVAPTIGWLFLGRIVAGMMGASYTTASAYIADISTPEKRSQNFGIVGAAFGLGFILGPTIGGILGEYGSRVPFYVAAGCSLLNWLYGYFVLPESLDKQHRRKFEWSRANPKGSLMQLKKYPIIYGLVGSLILVYLSAHAVQTNWSFYTTVKFNWTPGMIGASLAFVGVIFAVVQGWLIKYIIKFFGNEKTLYVGLGFNAAGYVLYALATQSWMMFAFTVVYCLGGIATPALQGIISNQVPPNEQGELQGGLTSMVSLTTIAGPPLMTSVFTFFTTDPAKLYLPGAPMFLGAIFTIIATVMARRTLKKSMQKGNAAVPITTPH